MDGTVWVRRLTDVNNVMLGLNQPGAKAIAATTTPKKEVYWVVGGTTGSIGTAPW